MPTTTTKPAAQAVTFAPQMNAMTAKTYGQPSIGCYLDQANRNSMEHDAATVELAIDFGFEPDRDTKNALARLDCDVSKDDDSEMLSYMADEAIEWLNSQETRTGLYWANDGEAGAFGLWVGEIDDIKEQVEFVSVRSLSDARSMGIETDPDDSSYPPFDYRGEWLHVNDHGNCTLYVRESTMQNRRAESYTDREIWSIV